MCPTSIHVLPGNADLRSMERGQIASTSPSPSLRSSMQSRTHSVLGSLGAKIRQNPAKIGSGMLCIGCIAVSALTITGKIKLDGVIALMLGGIGVAGVLILFSLSAMKEEGDGQAHNLQRNVAEQDPSFPYGSYISLPLYTSRPSSFQINHGADNLDNVDAAPPLYSLSQHSNSQVPNSDAGYIPLAIPPASLISNRVRSDNNHPVTAYDGLSLPLLQTQE